MQEPQGIMIVPLPVHRPSSLHANEYFPDGQSTQADAPTLLEYDPPLHPTQEADDGAPVNDEYRPAGHLEQFNPSPTAEE